MFNLMSALRRQLSLHFDGAVVLPTAKTQIQTRQQQRDAHRPHLYRTRGQIDANGQNDRVNRVYDAHPIPGNAHIAKRQQKLCAVTGEHIQRRMRRIADERRQNYSGALILEPLQPQKRQRRNQSTNGNKRQAVGEMAMISPADGRVIERKDKDIQISDHAANSADPARALRQATFQHCLRGCRAQYALRN